MSTGDLFLIRSYQVCSRYDTCHFQIWNMRAQRHICLLLISIQTRASRLRILTFAIWISPRTNPLENWSQQITFRKFQNIEQCFFFATFPNKLKSERKPVAEKLDQSVSCEATTAENIWMTTFCMFGVIWTWLWLSLCETWKHLNDNFCIFGEYLDTTMALTLWPSTTSGDPDSNCICLNVKQCELW